MTAEFGPHWSPDRIRQLTPTELLAIAYEYPPGETGPIRDSGTWLARLAKREAEEAAWCGQ